MSKTIFNITALILMGLISAAASADPADVNLSKSSLNVDFNKMIEEGAHNRAEIQKHIDAQIAVSDEEDLDSEKSRVLDFVDVEVGIGEAAPGVVVDRRFDSVGESTPAAAETTFDLKLVPNYKGGS